MMSGNDDDISSVYPLILPPSRLGKSHASLRSFLKAAYNYDNESGGSPDDDDSSDANLQHVTLPKPRAGRKSYSLVVVTHNSSDASQSRILLGRKHRGFGRGLYNSFGGKIDQDESPAEGAVRELIEEANIAVPLDVMERGEVGTLCFTFEDQPDFEMVVHLYRIELVDSSGSSDGRKNGVVAPSKQEELCHAASSGSLSTAAADLSKIRGCEEITPQWFEMPQSVPFDNMFADDSIWMPLLLRARRHLRFDGYFHFDAAVEHLTCLDYHIDLKNDADGRSSIDADAATGGGGGGARGYTLEKRLFHQLHDNTIHSPSIKEFKECWAFAKSVVSHYGKHSIDTVIDVAGGHGALAALLLILLPSVRKAVVVDPAIVGGRDGVRRAWSEFYRGKELAYRTECLRTGLPIELGAALVAGTEKTRILVVACHACQHLSDETVDIATDHGVNIAVMPCCQKDRSNGGAWKALSKRMNIGIGPLMDVLSAGKIMSPQCGRKSGVSYQVKMKLIDAQITPQNRLIMGKACAFREDPGKESKGGRAPAHDRLKRAYIRAHRNAPNRTFRKVWSLWSSDKARLCALSGFVGVCAGYVLAKITAPLGASRC